MPVEKRSLSADTAGKSSVKMADLNDQQVPKSKTQVYADVAAKPEGDFTEYSYPRGELVSEQDVYPRMQISEKRLFRLS